MSYKKEILKLIKNMEIIKTGKSDIIVKANYGPSQPTKIPFYIDEKTACFVAAIIGDGHLRPNKFQIVLDGFNENLIKSFKKLAKEIFNRDFNITSWAERNKKRYRLVMDSKAVYLLLNKFFGIKSGKKSNVVKIPKQIKSADNSIKSAFLIGLMVTEGGRRRRGFGLSTSSKYLWINLIKICRDIKLKISKDKWIYKKYEKEYYGISFIKSRLRIMVDNCKDNEVKQILLNCKNFKEDY